MPNSTVLDAYYGTICILDVTRNAVEALRKPQEISRWNKKPPLTLDELALRPKPHRCVNLLTARMAEVSSGMPVLKRAVSGDKTIRDRSLGLDRGISSEM